MQAKHTGTNDDGADDRNPFARRRLTKAIHRAIKLYKVSLSPFLSHHSLHHRKQPPGCSLPAWEYDRNPIIFPFAATPLHRISPSLLALVLAPYSLQRHDAAMYLAGRRFGSVSAGCLSEQGDGACRDAAQCKDD